MIGIGYDDFDNGMNAMNNLHQRTTIEWFDQELSKWRSSVLGICIIWITLLHMRFNVDGHPIIDYLKNIGYAGVDVMFFISGWGCVKSLERNATVVFLKNRLYRIIPKYFCILVPYLFIQKHYFDKGDIKQIFRNIYPIGHWDSLTTQFNWFIGAILTLYLLAPIAFLFIDTFQKNSKVLLGMILFCISIGVGYFDTDAMLLVSRIPIFLLGMMISKGCINLRRLAILAFFVSGNIVLYWMYFYFKPLLWNKGMYWYPWLFITPGFLYGTFMLLACGEKILVGKLAIDLFKTFGKYSYDIFLVNVLVTDSLFFYLGLDSTKRNWIIATIISVITGVILGVLWNCLKDILGRLRKTLIVND